VGFGPTVTSLEGSLGRGSIPVPTPNGQLRADLPRTLVDPWWPLATVG
jgi:hypothetical protein